MNKSQKIHLSTSNITSDKHIKVRLEQNIDTLEFLSMSIDTKDVYQDFNGDYGVLVGRVNANEGVGIPNAKISIFIPLSDEDSNNSEIFSIYPYKTPRDKNNEGKRYNLLPRVGKIDTKTGMVKPQQPFGSFPIKEEVVTNESYLEAYKKYYKYTALTNSAGDYMIFGVPVGLQTVHLSVDITDIGEYSMTPASMVINLGYSPNLFTENNTKIKPSKDLTDLPHIETQEVSVNIVPFWGDTTNFEIGITRQDFRIRSRLDNTFVIFGSVFTDGDGSMWGDEFHNNVIIRELFRARNPCEKTIGIASKRIGIVSEKIFYYPNNILDKDIAEADPNTMMLLDPSEYSIYKRDGDFALIISCNRNKVITDNYGNKISISDTSDNGIFTKFRGYMILEYTIDNIPMNWTGSLGDGSTVEPIRYGLKFPQHANQNKTFRMPDTNGDDRIETLEWKRQHYTFSGGCFYSISKFHGLTMNHQDDDSRQDPINGFFGGTKINDGRNDPFWTVGTIVTSNYGDGNNNSDYQFPSNFKYDTLDCFGANWMNLSVYLPQIGYIDNEYSRVRYARTNDNFQLQGLGPGSAEFNGYFTVDNDQKITNDIINTKWLGRSDLNWTDFIEVHIDDIRGMNNPSIKKGFTNLDLIPVDPIKYRNGKNSPSWGGVACPISGGKKSADPTLAPDPTIYFYKGFGTANCIGYLSELGLIS